MIAKIFIDKNWYLIFLGIILLFLASYLWVPLFYIAVCVLAIFVLLTLADVLLLYRVAQPVAVQRNIPEVFHLGEFNSIDLHLDNLTNLELKYLVIEEIPDIFQVRNFALPGVLKAREKTQRRYEIKAVRRGQFRFERTVVYLKTAIGFIQRRINIDHAHLVRVYPSTRLFKKYQLLAASSQYALAGNRQLRKIGHSMEFDQIRDYVQGDDIRSINWKATARKGNLMVNNYIDEKSQTVYSIIDGGRLMHYTFDGLSLLDYAVNASLLLSKIVLLKEDKAGLILFNDTVRHILVADKQSRQMLRINQLLYNYHTDFKDSSFEHLVNAVSHKVTQRSLLVLYTNFESKISFDRQLVYFRQLAKKHLLCVVFFENTVIKAYTDRESQTLEEVFVSTIAEKYAFEKKQIVRQLKNMGIVAILTTPQQLNTDVMNKYLELKASQMI